MKSGIAPGTTRDAISRLPIRVTATAGASLGQDLADTGVGEEGLDVECDQALQLGGRGDRLDLGAARRRAVEWPAGRSRALLEAREHQHGQHDLRSSTSLDEPPWARTVTGADRDARHHSRMSKARPHSTTCAICHGPGLFKPTTLVRALEKLGSVQADPIRAPARAQDLTCATGWPATGRATSSGSTRARVEEDAFVNYGFLPRADWALMHRAAPGRRIEREAPNARPEAGARLRAPTHPRELEAASAAPRWELLGGRLEATTDARRPALPGLLGCPARGRVYQRFTRT
jgi:hypothetical protein